MSRAEMVRLILLRHATAEPARSGQTDHDRPLSAAGRLEAAEAGRSIQNFGERPELVLCSTATRTRQTAELMMAEFERPLEIRFNPRLFDTPDYLGIIRGACGPALCTIVVGHNPFVQDTVASLAGASARHRPDGPERSFPPAAFAILSAELDWSDLTPGSMVLERFVSPSARG